MILDSLRATGFMRYLDLHLHDLPSAGAIAIIGENESGKTTIGEAVAFALFGETVKTRATDLSQVVSWDADEARVALEFTTGAGGYRVERRADKRGLHEARLYRRGEERPLAEGPEAVDLAIREATGLSFDEFRHSLYLAQAELGLVRRGDGEGDVGKVVHEMVGIGAMDRAAAAARKDLERLRDEAADLGRRAGVARAVAEAHKVPAGYGDELEREAAQLAAQRDEAERRIPELTQRVAKLRDAEAARERAGAVFERLLRAVKLGRAERALAGAGRDLSGIARGLESEQAKAKRELQHHERSLGEVRGRVDRLIDYQAKIAELEARLDLYKLEVKRSLDAPEIEAEDVEELEGLALPATPAAGLQLSQARVVRLQRARRKAITRAVVYAVLAVATGLVGAPSLWKLRAAAAPDEAGPASEVLALLEKAVAPIVQATSANAQNVWLSFAAIGTGLAFLFAVLCFQRVRRAMERGDQVKLAKEAVERLEKEVKELQSERERLERLDLRKPLKFAEEAKDLKNRTVFEQFQKIRELHNDFVSSPEQRDALVQKARAEEAKLREQAQSIENRLARLERIRKLVPDLGPDARGEEEAIPEKLDAVEARVKGFLDRIDEAERDRRDVQRAAADATQATRADEPIALFKEVQDPLERAWRAVGDEQGRAQFITQTRLAKLAANPGELDGPSLKQALAREEKLFDELVPRAERLRAEREKVEEEKRGVEAKHVTAVARLTGLGPRIEDVRGKRTRWHAAVADAERVEAELARHQEGGALAELTAELLEETAQDLRRRIGPMLSKYAAAVLPRLTGNRYRKVKVSPDLEIRVYSPEKNDFVPLVDLSIGAADQLLLAIRLAVGRALVSAKGFGTERHFLFLDEPLASFDEHRAKAFLEILREHASTFPQVFVVAHLHIHGLEDGFARVITPRIDARVLDTANADAGEEAAAAAAPGGAPGEASLAREHDGTHAGEATLRSDGPAAPHGLRDASGDGGLAEAGMDTLAMLSAVSPRPARAAAERRADDLLDMDDLAVPDEEGEGARA